MHIADAPTLHLHTTTDGGIADYVKQRISLYAQRRIIWLRHLWQRLSEQSNGPTPRHMEVDGYLWQIDNAEDEFNFYASVADCINLTHRIDALEKTNEQNAVSKRYKHLLHILQLTPFEDDTLQLCFALAQDNELGRVLAYLHNDSGKPYVSAKLVAQLFGHETYARLRPDSTLLQWKLIYETEPGNLELDNWFGHWLNGFQGLDDVLASVSQWQQTVVPHASWPLQETAGAVQKLLEQQSAPIRLLVTGAIHSGRKSFAACLCALMNKRLLTINASLVPASQQKQLVLHAQRMALLTNTVLCWQGLLLQERFEHWNIPSANLQVFIGEPDERLMIDSSFTDIVIAVPLLTITERKAAWQEFVPAFSAWDEEEKTTLVQTHQIALGTIVQAGNAGCASFNEAIHFLKATQAHQLGQLAHTADASFAFDDLVINQHVLQSLYDFCFEAKERSVFWEKESHRKLFPQGKSLVGLFSGSPGTGKTMAAQIVANSLGLSLYRVDLSEVISKYIGESAKNLQRILSRASAMNIVLLFDEADALFGKRTETKDAHDRYANTDTNYLLQAIEEYSGIVILSTNRKTNIDPAFLRRFRYVIEFPRPEPAQRQAIWIKIIAVLCGEETAMGLQSIVAKLSSSMELTGAQIKQAVLSAVFIAQREGQQIQGSHLLRGIEREMAKEGKALSRDWQSRLQ